MSNPHPLSPLRESDYEAIEAAVMETEKGRWFLAEYARRNRTADTAIVLDAIGALEKLLKRERRPDIDRIRFDIAEMKDAIERTKLEIAQIKLDRGDESRFETASNELDAIVTQTESATSDILDAAEKMQEVVWTMREGGIDTDICDALEGLVMTIYTSCSFQDLTGQRTQKVVHVLRYLESRIDAMIGIWGMEESEVANRSSTANNGNPYGDSRPDAHLLNGPALEGQGVAQSEVDDLFGAAPGGHVDQDFNEQDFDSIDFDAMEFDQVATDPTAAPEFAFEESAADTTSDGGRLARPDAPEAPAFVDEASEPQVDDAIDASDLADPNEALTRAAEAMEEAIGTLRDVANGTAPKAARRATGPDPLDKLSRAERQALFS